MTSFEMVRDCLNKYVESNNLSLSVDQNELLRIEKFLTSMDSLISFNEGVLDEVLIDHKSFDIVVVYLIDYCFGMTRNDFDQIEDISSPDNISLSRKDDDIVMRIRFSNIIKQK